MPTILFMAQLTTTLFMTGLIWFVQTVHYPLFHQVFLGAGRTGFSRYQVQHSNRTAWLVFPPMTVELLTALAALIPALRPLWISNVQCLASAILVALIWISTGLLQVPLHNALGTAPETSLIRRLVLSNWLRTTLWTARSLLLLYILRQHLL